jgi:hypothetical protein
MSLSPYDFRLTDRRINDATIMKSPSRSQSVEIRIPSPRPSLSRHSTGSACSRIRSEGGDCTKVETPQVVATTPSSDSFVTRPPDTTACVTSSHDQGEADADNDHEGVNAAVDTSETPASTSDSEVRPSDFDIALSRGLYTDGTVVSVRTGRTLRFGPYPSTFSCPCVSLTHRFGDHSAGVWCGAKVATTFPVARPDERSATLTGTCKACVSGSFSVLTSVIELIRRIPLIVELGRLILKLISRSLGRTHLIQKGTRRDRQSGCWRLLTSTLS